MKNVVLLADEGLYEVWITLKLDIREFEKLEKTIGLILAIDSTYDSMLKKLKGYRLNSVQNLLWKKTLESNNTNFWKILGENSPNLTETCGLIEERCNCFLEVIRKIDRGTSKEDAALVANAQWIRLNTSFEPVIVSEDRDLLTTGHFISSYYGLTIGFLSVFEILRLAELDLALPDYCRNITIGTLELGMIDPGISKRDLEEEISKLMKKSKISCHPTLRRHDRVSLIIRT